MPSKERGVLESWMWNLSHREEKMSYISLHKSKNDRAHKGGKIIGLRDASKEEVAKHQTLLVSLGKDEMHDVDGRKIVIFKLDPNWNKLWPKDAKTHQMSYKGIGFIDV